MNVQRCVLSGARMFCRVRVRLARYEISYKTYRTVRCRYESLEEPSESVGSGTGDVQKLSTATRIFYKVNRAQVRVYISYKSCKTVVYG